MGLKSRLKFRKKKMMDHTCVVIGVFKSFKNHLKVYKSV